MSTAAIAAAYATSQATRTADTIALAVIRQQQQAAEAVNAMLAQAAEQAKASLPAGVGGAIDRAA